MNTEQLLFSYGTLRQREVQLAVFGREIEMIEDIVLGFRIEKLAITDVEVMELSGSDTHPILVSGLPDDRVSGSLLSVTGDDLANADAYEAAEYARVAAVTAAGRRCEVYVHRDHLGAPSRVVAT